MGFNSAFKVLIVNVNLIFLLSQTSLVYGIGHSTFVIHRGVRACMYHIYSWHSCTVFYETACGTINAIRLVWFFFFFFFTVHPGT